MSNNYRVKALLTAAGMILITTIAMAQGPGGGPGGSGTGAPIDGGIMALVAGSVAYAYKTLKSKKNGQ